jgi:folate-binding protein YgfZ
LNFVPVDFSLDSDPVTKYIRGMNSLALHELHSALNARFTEINGEEAVKDYGDVLAEHSAVREKTGILDLSFRGRICLLGADRQRFLNGQVTNDVKALKPGQGCYAALITAKGKMVSDLNIYFLDNEILLDFEPGISARIAQRLEKYIIADDVQVVDVAPHYGLLSAQGPNSAEVMNQLRMGIELPSARMNFSKWSDGTLGEIYIMNLPRAGTSGFDLFVPIASLGTVWDRLMTAAKVTDGRVCGWDALEMARIEAGIPRFGADFDESNLPPEAGLEQRAVSYTKGCYIGQEVLARIRTYGQVAKALRGLRLSDELKALPKKGDKLFKGEKEIGYVTSALNSPVLRAHIALGYVRREANETGAELRLRTLEGESAVTIVPLPFTG